MYSRIAARIDIRCFVLLLIEMIFTSKVEFEILLAFHLHSSDVTISIRANDVIDQ